VAEGLSTLIHKAVNIGDIHGVQVCRGAPVVSHLFFVDDCFLFSRANVVEAQRLLIILKTYEAAFGQENNLSKSEVFFSRNMSGAAQEDLSHIIGVRHVMGTGKYLGLPSMIGRDKRSIFSFIKDRIWRRINAWKGRALSKAGKEVMIKSMLQSIPSYIMSIYLLPNSVIDDIEKMINAFWWGGRSNNRRIKWMAWERVACPKEFGGMGFRNFKAFNLSMVAKQGWSFLSKHDSLVARVFKSRYFPRSSFLGAKLGNNPSFAWRSIWNSRQLLLYGYRWTIGHGQPVSVMNDPWVRGVHDCWVQSPQSQDVHSLRVSDLIANEERVWDIDKIESLFSDDIVQAILDTPLFAEVQNDRIVWMMERAGGILLRLAINWL